MQCAHMRVYRLLEFKAQRELSVPFSSYVEEKSFIRPAKFVRIRQKIEAAACEFHKFLTAHQLYDG